MKKNERYLLYGGLTLFFLLMSKMSRTAWYTITDWLIPEFEGFSSTPYWDNKQYTWGYGTRAPGPGGSITKQQALTDMRNYLQTDYSYLSTLVTRKLSANQWAALLSFSYNLGTGNAKNLLQNINSGDTDALESEWKQYINSNGSPNSDLIARRDAEWRVWIGNLS